MRSVSDAVCSGFCPWVPSWQNCIVYLASRILLGEQSTSISLTYPRNVPTSTGIYVSGCGLFRLPSVHQHVLSHHSCVHLPYFLQSERQKRGNNPILSPFVSMSPPAYTFATFKGSTQSSPACSDRAGTLNTILMHIVYYVILKTMRYDVPEGPAWVQKTMLPQAS